jgi:hypothetical protein
MGWHFSVSSIFLNWGGLMITKKYVLIASLVFIPALVSARTIGSNEYMVWGIGSDQIDIPAGSVISEAVLTIKNITPQDTPLYIHLLDNAEKGILIGTNEGSEDYFDSYGVELSGVYENGNYVCRFSQNENAQSPVRTIYPNPTSVTLADSSTVQLSSALLELMDYAGNGRGVGVGIDSGDNTSYSIDSAIFELTIRSYTAQTSAQSLVFMCNLTSLACWSMAESSGTAVTDSSGNNNTAQLYGEVIREAGISGNGLRLDGINGCMSAMLDVSETNCAVSLWFKTTSLNGGLFSATYGEYGGAHDRNLFLENGKLVARIWSEETIVTNGLNLADGFWHHVVYTYGTSINGQCLYVDGQLAASGIKNQSNFTWQDRIYIGYSKLSAAAFFNGSIDEVQIYNKTLDEQAIQALYAKLAGHWSMDDNFGAAVMDSSGNNNIAQLYGGVTREAGSLQLDGINDCMSVKLDVSETNCAVSLWFKTTSLNGGLFSATYGEYGGAHDRNLFLENGKLVARIWSEETIVTNGLNLADGFWHHVVYTYGTLINGQCLYVDGQLAASGIKNQSNFTWQDRIYIGYSKLSAAVFFNGSIDEVQIYNKTLDEQAIQALYTKPSVHWLMDESFGTAVTDSSGNNNTAQLYGGVIREAGISGNGLRLDGVNGCMSARLDVSETNCAVSLWFKTTSLNGGLFSATYGEYGGAQDRNLFLENGNLVARIWSEETIVTNGLNLADGFWHHVVYTYGTSINGQRIYVDGQLAASGIKSQSDFTWQDRIYIGYSRKSAAPFLNGSIDEVQIYNKTLDEQAIQALYAR